MNASHAASRLISLCPASGAGGLLRRCPAMRGMCASLRFGARRALRLHIANWAATPISQETCAGLGGACTRPAAHRPNLPSKPVAQSVQQTAILVPQARPAAWQRPGLLRRDLAKRCGHCVPNRFIDRAQHGNAWGWWTCAVAVYARPAYVGGNATVTLHSPNYRVPTLTCAVLSRNDVEVISTKL